MSIQTPFFLFRYYNSGLFLLRKVLCSCFAGVYSELLLKSDGLHVDIFIQNAFLYIDSIACNIIVLCWQWNPEFLSQKSFQEIMDFKVTIRKIKINHRAKDNGNT